MIIGKRLTLRGFIVSDFNALQPRFVQEMSGWLTDGSVRSEETVVDGGVDAAGQAFVDLMRGANTGKMRRSRPEFALRSLPGSLMLGRWAQATSSF